MQSLMLIDCRITPFSAVMLVVLFSLSSLSFGQVELQNGSVIEITVKDVETGEPIPGAHVIDSLNHLIAVTDHNGSAKIQIREGIKVSVSVIGYEPVLIREFNDNQQIRLIPKTTLLGEIEVQAKRRYSAEVQEKIDLYPVSVVNIDRLKNRATNLNEVLSREAGTVVRNNGGLGSANTISVRELEGNRIALFLDKSPINYTDGSFSLNDLPINLIDRVEIYKGIIPADLGASGIGGAVNIVTKHVDSDYVDFNYMLQSYNTHSGSLIYKKVVSPKLALGIGGFLNYAENDYTMVSPFQPDLIIERDHDRYESYGVGAAATFHDIWFDEFRFEIAYYTNYRQLQGIQQNIQHAHNTAEIVQLEVDFEKDRLFTDKLSFSYRAFVPVMRSSLIDTSAYRYNFDGDQFLSPTGRGELGFYPNHSDNYQQDFQQIINFNYVLASRQSLNFNSVFRVSKNRPDDPLANEFAGQNITTFPSNLHSHTLSISHELKSANERLTTQLSVNHYTFGSRGVSSNILGVGNVEQNQIDFSTSRFGQSVFASYSISEDLLIKLGFQHAYRLPAPNELYGDGLLQIAAPQLRPEESLNYTAGLQYEKLISPLRDLKLGLTLFQMNLTNMIQLRGNGVTTAYTNVGEALIRGAELDLKWDITKNFYAYFNTTYQDVLDIQKMKPGTIGVENPTYGLRLPHIPWLFANGGIEYQINNFLGKSTQTRFYYESQYIHDFFYEFQLSVNQKRTIPAALTHNIGLEHSIWDDKLSLGLELRNLSDELVINNFNNPLPGRTFRIKLRYTSI
ncbi:MAG: TonB-dependent receptor [Bacteroidota bacterium]